MSITTTTDVAFRNTLIILGAIVLAVAIGLSFDSFLPIFIAVIGCAIWFAKTIFSNYISERNLRQLEENYEHKRIESID